MSNVDKNARASQAENQICPHFWSQLGPRNWLGVTGIDEDTGVNVAMDWNKPAHITDIVIGLTVDTSSNPIVFDGWGTDGSEPLADKIVIAYTTLDEFLPDTPPERHQFSFRTIGELFLWGEPTSEVQGDFTWLRFRHRIGGGTRISAAEGDKPRLSVRIPKAVAPKTPIESGRIDTGDVIHFSVVIGSACGSPPNSQIIYDPPP